MIGMESKSGKEVAHLPTGEGMDGVYFGAGRKRAARSDIRTNAYSVNRCTVRFRQASGDAIAQVQAVFVKQENRTQHSRTVSFDQAGDSRQNFVQRCTEQDTLQRIEHRIAGQRLHEGWGRWKRFQVGRCLRVCHKPAARQSRCQQYRTNRCPALANEEETRAARLKSDRFWSDAGL